MFLVPILAQECLVYQLHQSKYGDIMECVNIILNVTHLAQCIISNAPYPRILQSFSSRLHVLLTMVVACSESNAQGKGCIAMWYPLFKNIHCNYVLFLKANVVLLPFKMLMGRTWLLKPGL